MKRKLSMLVMAAFAAVGAWGEDGRTIAFYPLAEAVAGETVGEMSFPNAAADGTSYEVTTGTMGAGNSVPVYSDDVPAPCLYSDIGLTNVLCATPHSLAFSKPEKTMPANGSYVKLAGLGTDVGNTDAFTIECFVKYETDTTNTWRNVFSFAAHQGLKCANTSSGTLGIQNTSFVNKGGDQFGTPCAITQWHHVAVTYSKEDNRAYVWTDYVRRGSVFFTNETVTASKVFVLGANTSCDGEAFYGKVCALRVTEGVLPSDRFVRASFARASNQTVAFYPFKDGVAGEAITTVTNALGAGVLPGTASANGTSNEGTDVPRFTTGPGRYLISSLTNGTILCTDPGAIQFSGNEGNQAWGGRVLFPSMSTQLSMCGDFTVECFALLESDKTWRTLLEFNAGCDCKIALPGSAYNNAVFQDKTKGTGVSIYYNYPGGASIKDGKWHHYAVTYSAATCTSEFFVDYVRCGSFKSITNQPYKVDTALALGGHMTSNQEFFRGRVSGFRVSGGVLDPMRFLVSSDEPPTEENSSDTVYHWHLDGTEGVMVTQAPAQPINIGMFQGIGAGINGASAPAYSKAHDAVHTILWDGQQATSFRNAGCAEFFGCRTPGTDSEWKGSYLESRNLPAALHPRSFTLELFFKVNGSTISNNKLLMGKGQSDNNFTWKLEVSSSGLGLSYGCVTETDGVPESTVRTPILGLASVSELANGKWHHAAVTYDHDARLLTVYLDYKTVKSVQMGENQYLEENTAYIFRHGRYCNSHGFDGWMDEIRLSRRALGPDDFLRLTGEVGTTILFR